MAIKSYEKNGETLFQVYVNVRSKTNRSLRAQRKISGFQTEKHAKRAETKLIRECEREISFKENQGSMWEAVVDAWEIYILQDERRAETTKLDYVAAIRNHTSLWMKRPAAGISSFDVREVFQQMKAQGASIYHQNKLKLLINGVFTFGMGNGLIRGKDRSPTYGIQLGRKEETKPEILSIGEIRTLLEEAKKLEHPWYPIWAMAILTGMRNGELNALLWSDVGWESKQLSVTKSYNTRFRSVKCTKSGHWRTVPISSELQAILTELKERTGKGAHILPRLTGWAKGEQARILRQFCVGIGLRPVKFHTLRACFATQLIRNGVPPIQIQKICGWRDLETMQRYIRLAGIESEGVTEVLKVLPEQEVTAKVVSLFGRIPDKAT